MPLNLDERRVAMLAEMGIRVWLPPRRLDQHTGGAAEQPHPGFAKAPAASLGGPGAVSSPPGDSSPTASVQPSVRTATLLVVVDAPNCPTDDPRHPVGGEEGILLDRMLAAVGRTRGGAGDHGFDLIAACEAPIGSGGPTEEDFAPAAARLAESTRKAATRAILALGRFAAAGLCGVDEPIGRLRGRVHLVGSTRVVVTFPLGFLVRQPARKAEAWADLCLVASIRTLPSESNEGTDQVS